MYMSAYVMLMSHHFYMNEFEDVVGTDSRLKVQVEVGILYSYPFKSISYSIGI